MGDPLCTIPSVVLKSYSEHTQNGIESACIFYPLLKTQKPSIFSNSVLHSQWCVCAWCHYSSQNVMIMLSVNIKTKFDSTEAAGNG